MKPSKKAPRPTESEAVQPRITTPAEEMALVKRRAAETQAAARRADEQSRADPAAAYDRAQFEAALADPNSPLRKAADKRLEEMSQAWELVGVRLPPALKAELQAAARQARRSLSAEMRLRLQQGTGGGDSLRLVLAAIRARVPHEQIERLIEFWEG